MATKSASTTETPDIFSPVSVDRVSQVIVDQIKLLIRDGRLQPGDRLPSERELCQRFGVSRVTVREALRVLEATGLLTIRVGAHGGSFLTSPSTQRLSEGLADLISFSRLTAANITEARMVVELGILPLAVERATGADIAALFAMVDEAEHALDAGTHTMEMSAAFHVRVAECTHNPAFTMLVQSFHGRLLTSLAGAHPNAAAGYRGVGEHRKLAQAMKDRDLAAAREIATTHLDRTARGVRQRERSGDREP